MLGLRCLARLIRASRRILIFCHQNADPDAICSAFATQFLSKNLQKEAQVDIIIPVGMSRVAKKVVEYIPIGIENEPTLEKTDLAIIVDTNNIKQLGKWGNLLEKSGIPLVIIDHHALHPQITQIASHIIRDENVSSTCEIIFEMLKKLRIKQTKKIVNAILIGMVYETRHLSLAHSKTLINIAELIRCGGRIEDAMLALQIPMSKSERMARLKAVQRLAFIKIEDWLLASARTSSYQASVARIITSIGSHVAVVGGKNKDELSISLRCTREFSEKTGIHLGRDIAISVGELLNGAGGGHAMAAGINGCGELEDGIEKCINKIREIIH